MSSVKIGRCHSVVSVLCFRPAGGEDKGGQCGSSSTNAPGRDGDQVSFVNMVVCVGHCLACPSLLWLRDNGVDLLRY